MYVLIKKLEPFEAYYCTEGMVRLCTEPYKKPTNNNSKQMYMHITNFSVNKKSENYVDAENMSDQLADEDATKRLFT